MERPLAGRFVVPTGGGAHDGTAGSSRREPGEGLRDPYRSSSSLCRGGGRWSPPDRSALMRGGASSCRRPGSIAVSLVVLLGFLTGCASGGPEFTPPLVWEQSDFDDDLHLEPDVAHPDVMRLVLLPEGEAVLTNFPPGHPDESDAPVVCHDVSSTDWYSGEAEWKVRTDQSLILLYSDSELVLGSDSGFIGGQDWSSVGFNTCGSQRVWWLRYVCGELEPVDDGAGDVTLPVCSDELLTRP